MIIGNPIIIGGDSGIPCVVTITTAAGAEVTATLNDKTVSVIADESGIATLTLEEEGVWAVSASDGSATVSTEINTSLSYSESITLE